MRAGPRLLSIAILAAAPWGAGPAHATWPYVPTSDVTVSVEGGTQALPEGIPDGEGGVIFVWQDGRTVGNEICAQRLDATGAPMWTLNGVVLTSVFSGEFSPVIAPDGQGGAFVAWYDQGVASYERVLMQRLSSSGTPMWSAGGIQVCTFPAAQMYPRILADGMGGAFVVWQDGRGSGGSDIYAQHVSGSGALVWGPTGAGICTAAFSQQVPSLISDGLGGFVVTWSDGRNAGDGDIYAQRLNPTGIQQWMGGGVPVCTVPLLQYGYATVADGSGGAVIAWIDDRSPTRAIYAQHIAGNGAARWTTNGLLVASGPNDRTGVRAISDEAGGAILSWMDSRAGNYDIFMQRIAADGTQWWGANGSVVCALPSHQRFPSIAPDGAGGAIIAWADLRGASGDIYAQRIQRVTGYLMWPEDGVPVVTALQNQEPGLLVPDGRGGVIVPFQDDRTSTLDLYAQRLDRGGGLLGDPAPRLTSVADPPWDDEGGIVQVQWVASHYDDAPVPEHVFQYRIWRSVPAAGVSTAPGMATASSRRSRREITADPEEAAASGTLLAFAGEAWEIAGTRDATGEPLYAFVIQTTCDSTADGNPLTKVLVQARGAEGYWFSNPDSGYSADDLAPLKPTGFDGSYASGTATLTWPASAAADLAGYRLYRGTTADFVPSPGNRIATQETTGYVDGAGAPYHYRLTAVDIHGNESPSALWSAAPTVGAEDPAVHTLSLAAPYPNPARDRLTLRYTLPRTGSVQLEIHDLAGRRLRLLRSGVTPAGTYDERWPLTDDAGRVLESGLYLVRLEVSGQVLTRRFAAIR